MKWIGQLIYDQIARFRDDIYLEDISTGTIASGGNLGLDSNNKIVKATVSSSSGDMTGVDLTAATGIDITSETNTTSGDYSATIGVDVSDFMTNGGNTRVLTATGADAMNAEANLTFDSTVAHDQLLLTSSTSPRITVKSSNTSLVAFSELRFEKDAADVSNGEYIGRMSFYGENNAGTPQTIFYAQILGSVADITDGQEAGRLYLGVAGGDDGSMLPGLIINGDTNAEDEIDASIGYGAGSTTTIAGTLTMGSTAAMTNAGLLSVANQSNITGLGTITSGTWNGTKITDIYTNSSGKRYGSTIKILPTDFIQNEDGGVNKSHQFDDNGTIGVRATSTSAELWCFPSIPEGMKATHVHIKGLDSGVDGSSADDYAIEVHEYSLDNGGITSKGTGVVGTNLAITAVSSSATNCLAIRVDIADIDGSDTDIVYGGYVTIATI
tara:strand:- start:319 stop:1638 length:1320 start_codon:yes stop_codon:yes gene_type:complete